MAVDSLYKQRGRAGGRPFQKGQSGNLAGRPPGSRNRATLAAEALLEGEAQALTGKAIEPALEGDTTALRLCLDPPGAPRDLLMAGRRRADSTDPRMRPGGLG